jgi:S-adenosylmethionine decarboxylase
MTAISKKDHVFGFQLLLDFYGCKKGVCDDLDLCYEFLDKIVDDLGMKKQAPPEIFRSDTRLYPDKAGLSGWVPLIESSVVIHTLSKKNFISIDIYSCRYFDSLKAEEFCKKYFHPKKSEHQYMERGLEYYTEFYKSDNRHRSLTKHNGKTKMSLKKK